MHIDQYINEGQDPRVVEKLLLKLQDMLTSVGEEITYIAVQKKPAITLFPNSIALTNKRVFFCKSTKLGLASDFDIVTWEAIEGLSFKEGILGARVIFTRHNGDNLTMAHIPKNQARKLYQTGMGALNAPPPIDEANSADRHHPIATIDSGDELTMKLKKLKALFEHGLITEAEYENKKNELLSQL